MSNFCLLHNLYHIINVIEIRLKMWYDSSYDSCYGSCEYGKQSHMHASNL